MICNCKKDFQLLMERHRSCRFKTDPNKPVFQDPPIALPKHVILPDEHDVDLDSHLPIEVEVEAIEVGAIEEEESDIELTDISPEELIEQELDAERIKQELAMLELARLTKKKVRKTKPI